ncbi:ATPase [Halorubrum sp. Atlit-8R]|uniref:BREX system ATP-binding domain-containing protein n=1 Tax=unclassified Halorubrum TaxID=2642239 RepID=UPI000EF29450|nr:MULTISPECIES: BREX system ATP-binding domain-containing protein [unclassified Halorubrum]RLM63823.1 ATPase [Halorubrum sp. Atlit-9R]RLM77201.1 ATPase [Halorubrum sp. Atlit-8R]
MSDAFTITDEQQDYSQYDLDANPFPYSPVPAEDPEIYCGQQHVSDKISSTVSSMLSTGKSKHLVVTGKYGNGKSHTLKYTRSLLRDRDDVVVGYVAQPGEGFLDIYHEFVYDLGFNRVQKLAYEYLASITREVTELNPMGATTMQSLIDEGEVLLSDIVPEAIRQLSDVTKFADFARAIIHMVYEDTNLYAWQWLTAEGIRYEQRKEMEIHSALDDDTMGVRAFTALKNMLLELGYTGIFVFVDEFESIAQLSPKNEQATLNSIRHLMDQNSSGLCMLFGCAPEVWQDVMSEYHAFSERIGEEVALKPLTNEHLKELVSNYLDRERDGSNEGSSIAPFTDEGLDVILQRSQGNIRQALAICSRVLDAAVEESQEVVTPEFVQESM